MEEDPRTFRIRDTLSPGSEGIEAAMEERGKKPFEEWFPHGQELIHLVPSEGAKPPGQSLLMSQNDVPPPPVKPKIIPVTEPLDNCLLPEDLSLEEG